MILSRDGKIADYSTVQQRHPKRAERLGYHHCDIICRKCEHGHLHIHSRYVSCSCPLITCLMKRVVKQSIGRMNILPWSSLWKSDYEPQGERNGDRHKTPLGGILLEFMMTIVMISASAAIPALIESVNLPGNIQTIAHCFILSLSLPHILRAFH